MLNIDIAKAVSPSLPHFFLKVRFSKNQTPFYDLNIQGFQRLSAGPLTLWGKGTVYRVAGTPCLDLGEALQYVADNIQRQGSAVTDQLDGNYLFLIEDKSSPKVWVLNNHYQVGNYHYYSQGDELWVATSFKKLVQQLRAEGKVHIHFPAVHNFVANGFNVSDETLIQNVKRSMAGFNLEISSQGYHVDNRFNKNFSFDRQKFEDLDEHLDKYIHTYQSALKDYLSSRKPGELGILLSGGHDTSFLMINASKVWPKPVHAFSVVFPSWSFDEGPLARNVCEKFGGKFHPVEFKPEHLDETINLVSACEEPVVGSSLPLYVLTKQARTTTDTLIGGDAGDTMWAEYYPVAEYHRWVKHWPQVMRSGAAHLATLFRKTFDSERLWELEHVAHLFTSNDMYDGFLRKLCTYRHFSLDYQKQLFAPEISQNISFSKGSYEVPFTKENFEYSLIEGKLFNGFFTYQSHHTYKGMENVGTEFYMPTIDRQVMGFINSLPWEWINGGSTFQRLTNSKVINRKFHKRALSRYLNTSEIYNRSFDIPWYSIMRPRQQMLAQLKRCLKKRGWYNAAFIDQLFEEFQVQKVKPNELLELRHHGYRIFTLLTLELWCQEYLDGREPSPSSETIHLEDYLAH